MDDHHTGHLQQQQPQQDTSAAAALPPPRDDLERALQSTGLLASGPSCWGPLQWMAMHQLLRGYPRENPTPTQRAALVNYMVALGDLMPCPRCAQHWKALAPSVQDATDSRYTALKWSVDVHNAVNARLHKPVLTYAQAVQAMQDMCPGNQWRERASQGPTVAGLGGRLPLTGPSSLTTSQIAATPLYLGTAVALGALALILLVVVIIMARSRAAMPTMTTLTP
jgi:hypothetical protein